LTFPPTSEKLGLLFDFLKFVSENPHLRVGELRREFARTRGLTESFVRRLDDVLWFSDFIKTRWAGIPPRAYRAVTPAGQAVLARGYFTLADFFEAPEWVRRWLVRVPPPVPVLPPRILHISVRDFSFWLSENWGFKVYVESPSTYLQPWQVPFDPSWLQAHGVDPSNRGLPYVVKTRAIILLDTLDIFSLGVGTKVYAYNVVGFKWVRMHPSHRMARMRAGREYRTPPYWRRHMIYDPQARVSVTELPCPVPGRRRWVVDFGNFSASLPPVLDIDLLERTFVEKVKKGEIERVPALWSEKQAVAVLK